MNGLWLLTLGTWTYLFQGTLVALLMILHKKFVPSYLFSFVVGFFFGLMMDLHELWITKLPLTIPLRILYFALSYIIICFGIALSNRCKLPIVPTDLFPRELAEILNKPYSGIKICFDVICLLITACMTYFLSWTHYGTWYWYNHCRIYDGKRSCHHRKPDWQIRYFTSFMESRNNKTA